MLSNWVTGGNLICMCPTQRLQGCSDSQASHRRWRTAVRVDGSTTPGAGIVADTIQFHGTADNYTVAEHYGRDAQRRHDGDGDPAVTLRTVGRDMRPHLP